jgi:transposase-like protein
MIADFKSVFDLLKAFPTEQHCIDHLTSIRWNGLVVSPFDETSKVYICKGNKYRCKNTGKYFNVRTGTIFDNTKLPLLKWFLALYIFSSHKKGISSHQLAKDLTITQKSAWFVLHRLRYAFEHPAFKEIMGGGSGIAEADESYFGGKVNNMHVAKRKTIKNSMSPMIKTPVFGVLERGGNVSAQVVNNVRRETILPILAGKLEKKSVLFTDQSHIYTPLKSYYNHQTINHEQNQYANNICHTNTIEGFWSLLKRGVYGIYHHVSPEHLQSYVDEFTLRYNTRKQTTCNRFDLILTNVAGRKLTYKKLIDHE